MCASVDLTCREDDEWLAKQPRSGQHLQVFELECRRWAVSKPQQQEITPASVTVCGCRSGRQPHPPTPPVLAPHAQHSRVCDCVSPSNSKGKAIRLVTHSTCQPSSLWPRLRLAPCTASPLRGQAAGLVPAQLLSGLGFPGWANPREEELNSQVACLLPQHRAAPTQLLRPCLTASQRYRWGHCYGSACCGGLRGCKGCAKQCADAHWRTVVRSNSLTSPVWEEPSGPRGTLPPVAVAGPAAAQLGS